MCERVLILHGWGGSDDPHWQAWLAGELAKEYGTVSFPLLDNPHFPTKNRWMKQFKTLLNDFKPHTIICHSLANTLWFHLCNEGEIAEVQRLLLVAPPRLDLELDTIKSFFPVTPPKTLFAKEVMMVTSDNDPYMDQDEAFALQKELGVEMRVLEAAGHINADSGFGAWPWVLQWVKGEEA